MTAYSEDVPLELGVRQATVFAMIDDCCRHRVGEDVEAVPRAETADETSAEGKSFYTP